MERFFRKLKYFLNLFAPHGGKELQVILNGESIFEVLKQGLNLQTDSPETPDPAHRLGIAFHSLTK